ncbi:protein kinase superfamily protein [Striga asiatica]|uniref:Protein kinase superfamily protein n=1 Tax=Striga asiatica TaxID=4170 RepID=A0A5A7RAS4_STRAF|nr:protein kinase superfamily protein [Striga asiatica]
MVPFSRLWPTSSFDNLRQLDNSDEVMLVRLAKLEGIAPLRVLLLRSINNRSEFGTNSGSTPLTRYYSGKSIVEQGNISQLLQLGYFLRYLAYEIVIVNDDILKALDFPNTNGNFST